MTNVAAILFDISRETTPAVLHDLREEAQLATDISEEERQDICAAVDARFSALNALALGAAKGRWG